MQFKQLFILLMMFLLILPPHLSLAMGGKRAVVLVPVHNSNGDKLTDESVETLRTLLGKQSDLHVVSKKNIDSVLHYYEREGQAPLQGRAEELLAKAKDNYYRFNYIEAKSLANKAIAELTRQPQAVYDNGQSLLDAHLVLGIISRSMGNIGEARQAFREALRLDPSYQLDRRAFPPSMIDVFEGVRNSAGQGSGGSIKVESSPKVADVYLNGIKKGVTPLTIENLPAGEHYLKLAANKYGEIKKVVKVVQGKSVKIKEKLDWQGGERGELTGKNYVDATSGFGDLDSALKIGELLKADKVVLVDVDQASKGGGSITAKVFDQKLKAGHKPITHPFENSLAGHGPEGRGPEGINSLLSDISKEIGSETSVNIAGNPEELSDPVGAGRPELMGQKRKNISKTALWSLLGGAMALGLGGGLAAAFAGGGGGGEKTGSVNVNFR